MSSHQHGRESGHQALGAQLAELLSIDNNKACTVLLHVPDSPATISKSQEMVTCNAECLSGQQEAHAGASVHIP